MAIDLVCEHFHRLCVFSLGHSIDDVAIHHRETGWHLTHQQRLVDADSWRSRKHLIHTAIFSVSKTNLNVFNQGFLLPTSWHVHFTYKKININMELFLFIVFSHVYNQTPINT